MANADKSRQAADPCKLTPSQEIAAARLITGATDSEAAEAAGVARQTVQGWRHKPPAFIAHMNATRQALRDAHTDRIRSLTGHALDVLADDLSDSCGMYESRRLRQQAAIHILRAGGLYGAPPAADAPTDAISAAMENGLSLTRYEGE